ncbi:MAG TPA: PASTA domain-containing protein, partial [Candidatus Ozemobacteraceae bacterium]|nr:PASTA domain-containing protein [Candidatus Ozemobacteraceae bacterium]
MAKQESCLLILVKMILMVTLLLAGLIAGLFFLRDKLNEYFNRGENIPVPDFRGKHLVEVFKEKPADLIIEKRDEKFDPLVPKDHVIAQYPEPGIRVKPNKKILLTISMGTKQVNVPDLLEKNQREVTLALINNQLREGNRAFISSSRFPREKVIMQSPLPHSPHQIQGGVDLLISLGGTSARAPLPNFLGKGVVEAKASLQALGLTIGKTITKKDPSRTKDTVIMTRPGPYDPVTENATVDLLVSSGLDAGTATAEDLKRFETVEGPLPSNTPPAPPTIKIAASATSVVKLPPQT